MLLHFHQLTLHTPQASNEELCPETQIQHSDLDEDCKMEGEEKDPQPAETTSHGSADQWNFSCSKARLPCCEAEFAVGNATGQ